MTSYLAGLAIQVGLKLAIPVVNYGASTLKGHVAMGTLHTMKGQIESVGQELAGPMGRVMGNFIGRAVAGHNIAAATKNGTTVANAFGMIGHQVINLANHRIGMNKKNVKLLSANELAKATLASSVKSFNYKSAAYQTAKALGVIGGSLAIATGVVPLASIGIAFITVNAVPKIADSLFNALDPKDSVDLMGDIVTPIATQLAIQSVGFIVQGIVQYDTIQNAYELASKKGEQIAKGLTFFMPKSFQIAAGKLGNWVGHMDAGRQVMKEEVLENVANRGLLAKNVTEMGLGTIDVAVRLNTIKNEKNSLWKIAKNVGIVSTGVFGGTALVLLAPEIAMMTGGTVLLGISHKAIKWTRIQMVSKEKTSKEKKVQLPSETIVSINKNLLGQTNLKLTNPPLDHLQEAAPAA